MAERWLVMWWPVDEAIPAGWHIARQRRCHHNRWSILLEQVPA